MPKRADQDLDLRQLIARVRERMAAKRTNPTQVAKAARLGSTAVHDLLSGKNKNPSVPVISRIAKALQTSVAYLTGESATPDIDRTLNTILPIPVIGIAETGAFRKMPEFGPEREHELKHLEAPRSTAFPSARHFALEIRGDSMNAAKPFPLVEGMFALCVDVIDAGLAIESGRIYAVRQTLDGGQTYETTIKRAHVFRDRIELRPESTNPKHEPILVPRRRGDEFNSKELAAIGYVYGVFGSTEL